MASLHPGEEAVPARAACSGLAAKVRPLQGMQIQPDESDSGEAR